MAQLRIDGWYKAEKGMHFVLTQKGKAEVASYKDKVVGEPVSEYDYEASCYHLEEGYLEEVSIPNWITKEGYEVVYDHKGFTLHAGNSIVFPERELAEKYLKNYQEKAWVDKTLYIKLGIFEGKSLSECRVHAGKKVYNKDWYYGIDALEVGDLVEEDIVDELINCLPPRSMRENCTQLGEPYSHEIDQDGRCKPTFATFKRIAEHTWEFCGNCFGGKNVAVKIAA